MRNRNLGGRNLWIGVIAILVIIGLLLPPISLAERVGLTCAGTTLDARTPATTTPDGLTLALSDPAQSLTFKTQAVSADKFDANQAGDELLKARDALPVNLLLRSPIYQLDGCGQTAVSGSLAINLPEGANTDDTYDLYAWDGAQWMWLGAYLDPSSNTVSAQIEALPRQLALFQSTSVAPYVAAQITPGQAMPADAVSLLNEVYVYGWTLADDGSLMAEAGTLPATGNARLIPVVRSEDAGPVRTFLASDETVKAHVTALSELAARGNFAGVAIDYRGLPTDYRGDFTRFVQQLATSVHAQNRLLAVVLPAPAIDANGAPDMAGYDWVAIGAVADMVQSDFGKNPNDYLEGNVARALIDWAPTQVNRYKFQPIVSLASLDTPAGGQPVEVSFADAIKPIGQLSLAQPMTVTPGSDVKLLLDNPTSVSEYTFDNQTFVYRFNYQGATGQHAVMVNTAASLGQRLSLLLPRRMRGVVISGLSGDVLPNALSQALTGFRQQAVPGNLSSELNMDWKIAGNGQTVLNSTRPITDTTIVWKAPTEPGTYNIAAMIGTQSKGQGQIIVSGSVSETLSATAGVSATGALTTTVTPTATVSAACLSAKYIADVTVPDGTKFKNTEAFTKTWKIRNDGSCNWPDDTTLVFVSGTKMGTPDSVKVGQVVSGTEVDVSVALTAPEQFGNYTGLWQLKSAQGNFGTQLSAVIVAGDAPANVVASAPNAPPVVAPGAIGSFELGGHIDGLGAAALMNRAGMKWVKVQTFAGGNAAGIIDSAHAAGFKVLLGVLGDKSRVTDGGYQDEYARSVASMAAAGADAIEVWNEPNIDREWPTGSVNGGIYTQLLAKAYNAIKAANGGTLVISAALAPTGYFAGGCQAAGCNDDVFLQQMAAAGAASYMDCVGAHHNSGATAPSASSGHPADQSGHYSWYFQPTMNLYYGAFGGARKVCFTEFGYLSDDGFPSLESTAPGFAWASAVTVEQQAAWLAEAAAMSINSGKVRLMIIWNVNFTNYGSDPMAGYAIVRPGGDCPACDALGAIVGSR
ncbi:MAG: hypothetical protein HY870_08250 [Chloroflexi bacterium]|nr:hypothetical protein [Chloroflexota bacterium]